MQELARIRSRGPNIATADARLATHLHRAPLLAALSTGSRQGIDSLGHNSAGAHKLVWD